MSEPINTGDRVFKFRQSLVIEVSFKKATSILASSRAEFQADFFNNFFNELLLVTKSKEGLINQLECMEKHLDEFALMGIAALLRSYEERSS